MKYINQLIQADALKALKKLPKEAVDLAITSPPYWDAVDYGFKGQIGHTSYDKYINDMLTVWQETYRVLKPNGKLCINTPILPISKKKISSQHTRHYKNINNDIEFSILNNTKFLRYSLFIWKKQTSVKMFGSYPYPPNIYEDNTIEFINVFIKPGKPKKLAKSVKAHSKISQELWLELTKQVWAIYPEDVKRAGGHPAPFPIELPARLILMYSFKESLENNFKGDVVLDMFVGSGATCEAAWLLGRNYIGIDLSKEYINFAKRRLEKVKGMRGKVKPWDLIRKTANKWFDREDKVKKLTQTKLKLLEKNKLI